MDEPNTTPIPHGQRIQIRSPEVEIFISIDVLFILITLVGNSLIVNAVYRHKNFRKPNMLFIVSVAVSHILVGVVVLPMFIMGHFPDEALTAMRCKAIAYTTKFASTASLAAIIPLTVDCFLRNRGYYAERPLSWTSASLQVAATWLFAALYAIIHCVFIEFRLVLGEDDHGKWHTKVCHVPDHLHMTQKIIVLLDLTILFVLPVMVLAMLLVTLLWWYKSGKIPPPKDRNDLKNRRVSTRTSVIFLLIFTLFNIGNYLITMYIFWGPGSFRHIHLVSSICAVVGFAMCWVNVAMIFTFNATMRKFAFARCSRKHCICWKTETEEINGKEDVTKSVETVVDEEKKEMSVETAL